MQAWFDLKDSQNVGVEAEPKLSEKDVTQMEEVVIEAENLEAEELFQSSFQVEKDVVKQLLIGANLRLNLEDGTFLVSNGHKEDASVSLETVKDRQNNGEDPGDVITGVKEVHGPMKFTSLKVRLQPLTLDKVLGC